MLPGLARAARGGSSARSNAADRPVPRRPSKTGARATSGAFVDAFLHSCFCQGHRSAGQQECAFRPFHLSSEVHRLPCSEFFEIARNDLTEQLHMKQIVAFPALVRLDLAAEHIRFCQQAGNRIEDTGLNSLDLHPDGVVRCPDSRNDFCQFDYLPIAGAAGCRFDGPGTPSPILNQIHLRFGGGPPARQHSLGVSLAALHV